MAPGGAILGGLIGRTPGGAIGQTAGGQIGAISIGFAQIACISPSMQRQAQSALAAEAATRHNGMAINQALRAVGSIGMPAFPDFPSVLTGLSEAHSVATENGG